MCTGSQNCRVKDVLKYAGAFSAWVLGAGFATGQETLQFFASYGWWSYGALFLNLVGFIVLGQVLLAGGYDHKDDENFNHCRYYCGKRLGTFYSWLMQISLVILLPVLIAAGGATLFQHFGVSPIFGSALMAAMVLCAYLIGFERLLRTVALIGPTVILFSLMVSTMTIAEDYGRFSEIGSYEGILSGMQAAPSWVLGGLIYMPLTFFCGSAYYIAIGRSAVSRKAVMLGGFVGAAAVMAVITILSTAILLNARDASSLAVPTLFLARKLLPAMAVLFSFVLFFCIFSSCSTIMWSFCSRLSPPGSTRDKLTALAVITGSFLLGLLPFTRLVGTIYPFIGYLGLPFIGCVFYKGAAQALHSLKRR